MRGQTRLDEDIHQELWLAVKHARLGFALALSKGLLAHQSAVQTAQLEKEALLSQFVESTRIVDVVATVDRAFQLRYFMWLTSNRRDGGHGPHHHHWTPLLPFPRLEHFAQVVVTESASGKVTHPHIIYSIHF